MVTNREPENFYQAVYRLVRRIPPGRVMTYGQIATILGAPRAARAVGYALRACSGKNVPWQRVINAKGEISTRGRTESATLQLEMLEAEGIIFNQAQSQTQTQACELKKFRWEPRNTKKYYYGPSSNAPF